MITINVDHISYSIMWILGLFSYFVKNLKWLHAQAPCIKILFWHLLCDIGKVVNFSVFQVPHLKNDVIIVPTAGGC